MPAIPEVESPTAILERLKTNCFQFVFPPGQKVVPRAVTRMTAYARYGPALPSESGRLVLKSARNGEGTLRHHEEQLLIKEEEGGIVSDIYCSATPTSTHAASLRPPKSIHSSTIPGEPFGEMNAKKHPLVHQVMEMTRKELTEVLENVSLPDSTTKESTVFDALSNALLNERQRRINAVKTATPVLKDVRKDTEVTERSATRFYNRTNPKAYEIRSWEDPKDVLRALHRNVFQIAEPGIKSASLSLNVRCLRPDFELRDGSVKEGWDNYCCIRNSKDTRISTLRK